MSPFSFNGPIKCNTITSFSPLLFSLTYNSCNISLPRKLHRNVHVYGNSFSPFSFQYSIHRNLYSEWQPGISLIAFNAKNSESGGEENKVPDAVMKSYSAFNNKNTHELPNVHEYPRGVSNFLSFFQAFQGKTQVLEFISHLIRILGENVQVVVKPTLHDGMDVGVHWKFEWDKIYDPLGKGFSVHFNQTCRGKAVIRNFERFMEPLFHLGPFRLKMRASLAELANKIVGLLTVSESGNKAKRNLCIVLAALSLAILMCMRWW